MNIILKSESIFDSINNEPFKGYVEVEGKKIKKVGKGEIPNDYENSSLYRLIDCQSKTIMAGICDPHVHLFLGALDTNTINVNPCLSEEEAAEAIYNFYKDRDDEWCIAFGWTQYRWPEEKLPEKESLDKYFKDRPVLAFNDELHAVWVNSKAMELCGINKDTKDPLSGTIKRNSKGEPTGYLLEQPAMMMVTEIAFSGEGDHEKFLVKKFIEKAHSRGVTAVGDVHVLEINKYEVCGQLEKENDLKLRVFFSPPIEIETAEALELRGKYNSDKLRFLGLKGFIDGTPLGYTGMLVEEYSDVPGFFGEPYIDVQWLKEKGAELYKNNIPMRLHACGDGAVRVAMDVIENAQNLYGKKDVRNTIEHIENIHPEDIKRFKDLDVIASIQPSHMIMESLESHPIFAILGEERCKLTWPGKSLVNNQAKVTFSTDYPIVDLKPMDTLYRATCRVMEDDKPEEGWNPKEKFTLPEALKNITIEPAYLMKAEDKIGSLELGKLADIIVLDRNIFDMDIKEIKNANNLLTIFEGEIVFNKLNSNKI